MPDTGEAIGRGLVVGFRQGTGDAAEGPWYGNSVFGQEDERRRDHNEAFKRQGSLVPPLQEAPGTSSNSHNSEQPPGGGEKGRKLVNKLKHPIKP